jgi:hypothetical protein
VAGRIEDYAIVGNMQPAALICADGSVDRLGQDERRSVPG